MSRFNFNEIKITDKVDITKIMENFEKVESDAALAADLTTLSGRVDTHSTNITNLQEAVTTNVTNIGTKAPINHAVDAATYGLATDGVYGHTKVINNLTTASFVAGQALSAYQGKVLMDNINTKQKTLEVGTAAPSGGSNGDIYIQYF